MLQVTVELQYNDPTMRTNFVSGSLVQKLSLQITTTLWNQRSYIVIL
uniref:Uncharacterized protein n=1 Tax=Arundo donax TaxID=35708 RepID=A0A0A9F1B6_ARUDO